VRSEFEILEPSPKGGVKLVVPKAVEAIGNIVGTRYVELCAELCVEPLYAKLCAEFRAELRAEPCVELCVEVPTVSCTLRAHARYSHPNKP
jgi:hypothetical protein